MVALVVAFFVTFTGGRHYHRYEYQHQSWGFHAVVFVLTFVVTLFINPRYIRGYRTWRYLTDRDPPVVGTVPDTSQPPTGYGPNGEPIYPVAAYTVNGRVVHRDTAQLYMADKPLAVRRGRMALLLAFGFPPAGIVIGLLSLSTSRRTGQPASVPATLAIVVGSILSVMIVGYFAYLVVRFG